ncbi:hypothetical protein AZA_20989 [Nitrospirillum viridazoti Y2]|nr:hypothetical protein AZA_20989 [Nitrospirillum amazonense Y2]
MAQASASAGERGEAGIGWEGKAPRGHMPGRTAGMGPGGKERRSIGTGPGNTGGLDVRQRYP